MLLKSDLKKMHPLNIGVCGDCPTCSQHIILHSFVGVSLATPGSLNDGDIKTSVSKK